LKSITSKSTIEKTIRLLKKNKINDVYFDSFFPTKLDEVVKVNKKLKTNYARSLHLIGNITNKQSVAGQSREDYDIITIPYGSSFCNAGRPIIYGAVGSSKILEKIAKKSNVQGAYIRLDEGSGVIGVITILWNSFTNTERLRQKYIIKQKVGQS